MKLFIFLIIQFIALKFIGQVVENDSSSLPRQIFFDSLIVEYNDTIIHKKDSTTFFQNLWSHDPHLVSHAALFSAVLPGLGQIYNGKWWKVPIIYGALGTSGYFIYSNSIYYQDLKEAAILRFDGDSTTIDIFNYASDAALLSEIDNWKRYVDLSYIVTSVFYLLNIIDAVVDAQLYDFDISDDLSLHWRPTFQYQKKELNQQTNQAFSSFGIALKLNLK